MREILGKAKTVRELLKGVKYSIDYYQREYMWQDKQVQELLDDLVSRFLADYDPDHSRLQVREYGHYFLGSIIISSRDSEAFVVDGQQRLTTLTLLLIYLRNSQRDHAAQVNVDDLIYSERYGTKSFNLNVDERIPVMEALFEGRSFEENGHSESVRNIVTRYRCIEEHFPEDLTVEALPYFIDWLIDNVHLVEITAYADEDAYTIFETMNDRGLSLSATDMLKGYILANITDEKKRNRANDLWRQSIRDLSELGKDGPSDAIRTWLRAQYATDIRERRRGAVPRSFDLIGTEFHRWVRDHRDEVGLATPDDFCRFIERDLHFYTQQYMVLQKASRQVVPGLEHVLYNAHHGFTLQYLLLLAPLHPQDQSPVTRNKMRLVAHFLDILLTWRLWNFRSISYSTMQYAMFLLMRDIRGLDLQPLAVRLRAALEEERETFESNDRLRMHQQNRRYLHRILARMTDYIETESGMPSRYVDYVSSSGKDRYEIEHIWADKWDQHAGEFTHPTDFADYRNRFGGLVLLPKSFNASYGALPYRDKLPHYNAQNLLARSLHPGCYDHNPGFLALVARTGLAFTPHESFTQGDLDARQELYRQIAERIWNPDDLLREAGL